MSASLAVDHWRYVTDAPKSTGIFKATAADFQVIEDLGYPLTGDGEHVFLFIEKENLNTAYLAERLAAFAHVPLRQVTYAGRKDKFALCQQWFGVHLPGKGKPEPDWQAFDEPGVSILAIQRHNKKLRTGQLKGNRFIICLRDVTNMDDCISRLEQIAAQGVPNYYGSQRFGVQRLDDNGKLSLGGNLALAQRMINGETIRNRNKRSIALSALRSWLFNEHLSARIQRDWLYALQPGDAMNLQGSNSYFLASEIDDTLLARFAKRDISPTIPLWGEGKLATTGQVQQMEQDVADRYPAVCEFLQNTGLKMDRRAAIIWPEQLEWQRHHDTLTLSFNLPAGCFATSVLRECIAITEAPMADAQQPSSETQ